jgi:2-amino-4-hydroxy-6-hydroxymethyldihydropteridine diphosphokinase
MHIVYLSLGSNVGDRDANLRTAIASLTPAGVRVDRVSSIYETEPVDYQDQPWFLNCVLEAETDMQPQPLLQALRAIESQMGSKKEFAKGPRKIDLDILLYGSETIDTPELQIPHPRIRSSTSRRAGSNPQTSRLERHSLAVARLILRQKRGQAIFPTLTARANSFVTLSQAL